MASMLSLGKPYETAEQASKAKRSALLAFCALTLFQVAFYLFFWWMSRLDNSIGFRASSPEYDILLLILFGFLLYFFNSRLLAGAFLLFAVLELFGMWFMKASVTGDFAPPGIAFVFAAIAINLAVVAYKTHEWQQLV